MLRWKEDNWAQTLTAGGEDRKKVKLLQILEAGGLVPESSLTPTPPTSTQKACVSPTIFGWLLNLHLFADEPPQYG